MKVLLLTMISTTDELVKILESCDKDQDIFCAQDAEGNGYSHITNICQDNIVQPYECLWDLKYGGDVMHIVIKAYNFGPKLSLTNIIKELKKYPHFPLAIHLVPTDKVKIIEDATQVKEDPEYDIPLKGTGSCILMHPVN